MSRQRLGRVPIILTPLGERPLGHLCLLGPLRASFPPVPFIVALSLGLSLAHILHLNNLFNVL